MKVLEYDIEEASQRLKQRGQKTKQKPKTKNQTTKYKRKYSKSREPTKAWGFSTATVETRNNV